LLVDEIISSTTTVQHAFACYQTN